MKFKVEKIKNYQIMPTEFLKDDRLNLKDKGLLATIYSLPNDWDYTVKGLCKITNTGIEAIRNSLANLEIYGYMEREKGRTKKGTYEWNYKIFLKPKKTDVNRSVSIRKFKEKLK